MNTRCLTLHSQTRLAVQIVIEDDTGTLALSILLTTQVLALLWQLGQPVVSAGYELTAWVQDIQVAISFTAKVLLIGFKALSYGLGVSL